MKHKREITVGILGIIALFLLYFGFNFLKGVNIFSATNSFVGVFENIHGLTEQGPVYIQGYKVGQVDKIAYDFTKPDAFTVNLSINKDITLPKGTKLALVADGLLGGEALELIVPTGTYTDCYHKGDTLPSVIVPGLVDNLQEGLLKDLQTTVQRADSLLAQVQDQLEGNTIKNSLQKVERMTTDLQASTNKIKHVMDNDVQPIVDDAKASVNNLKTFTNNISDIDLAATVSRVDSAVNQVNDVVAAVNSKDGTLGLLLNDDKLYSSVNATVQSADSLLTDLKANPKRYVHFSLFGKKEK